MLFVAAALALETKARLFDRLEQLRGCFDRQYTYLPDVLPVTGKRPLAVLVLAYHNFCCLCVRSTSDVEAKQLEKFIDRRRGTYIFNDNYQKRYQVPFDPQKLPKKLWSLKVKFTVLGAFLRAAVPLCEPRNWVVIASLEDCERQHWHTDYDTDLIQRATHSGEDRTGYPFACRSP